MKKKLFIILTLLIFITIGITYAWWRWQSSTNTNVSFTIEGATITYNGGPDINNITLIPVSSKEVGETNGTGVAKTITASANKTMYLTLNLDLVTFPNALAEESLVWEIYKGNTKIGSGDFDNESQGNSISLFKDIEINSTTSTYKLYIYIDGTQENPSTMMNQDFVFHLNASVTDQEPNMLMAQSVGYNSYYDYYYRPDNNILGRNLDYDITGYLKKVYTSNSKTVPASAIESWDVSAAQNGSVMAWIVVDEVEYCSIQSSTDNWVTYDYQIYNKTYCDANVQTYEGEYTIGGTSYYANLKNDYILYLGQDGGVVANPNSSHLFCNLSVEKIDLTYFDTSRVTDMSYMFDSLASLTNLNLGNNFNTVNVTDMNHMFTSGDELIIPLTSLDLGDKFDTSNVTNMNGMFLELPYLTTLDLGNKFDTSNVTNMSKMFCYMDSLTTLNLGNKFDTSNVTNMTSMFGGMWSLTTIYASSDFDTTSLQDSIYMFSGCSSLVGGNNTYYEEGNDDASYAKIDRPGVSGYFTDISVLGS